MWKLVFILKAHHQQEERFWKWCWLNKTDVQTKIIELTFSQLSWLQVDHLSINWAFFAIKIYIFFIFPQVTSIWDWCWKSLQQLMLATPSTSTYSRWMGQTLSLNSGYKHVKDVRKTSLFLNFLFLCMHWLYMDIDMWTQQPFCSLFLFTEGIQNKGSVRSEVQKTRCTAWGIKNSLCSLKNYQSLQWASYPIQNFHLWVLKSQHSASYLSTSGEKKSNCW